MPISRGFPENHEFRPGGGHALGLEQQIAQIPITPSAAQQRFDVAVDCFDHAHAHLCPAVIQDAMQMLMTGLTVIAGMVFSLSIAILTEELIFGKVFGLFFARQVGQVKSGQGR